MFESGTGDSEGCSPASRRCWAWTQLLLQLLVVARGRVSVTLSAGWLKDLRAMVYQKLQFFSLWSSASARRAT